MSKKIFRNVLIMSLAVLGITACLVPAPSQQRAPEVSSLDLRAAKRLINSLPEEAPFYYAEGIGPPCAYKRDSDAEYRITQSTREFSEGASATLECPLVNVFAPGGSSVPQHIARRTTAESRKLAPTKQEVSKKETALVPQPQQLVVPARQEVPRRVAPSRGWVTTP